MCADDRVWCVCAQSARAPVGLQTGFSSGTLLQRRRGRQPGRSPAGSESRSPARLPCLRAGARAATTLLGPQSPLRAGCPDPCTASRGHVRPVPAECEKRPGRNSSAQKYPYPAHGEARVVCMWEALRSGTWQRKPEEAEARKHHSAGPRPQGTSSLRSWLPSQSPTPSLPRRS